VPGLIASGSRGRLCETAIDPYAAAVTSYKVKNRTYAQMGGRGDLSRPPHARQ
jgi:hypothetical protein